MVNRKIKVRGNTFPKVDHALVGEGLGVANHRNLFDFVELTEEQAKGYQQLGSSLMVSDVSPSLIYYLGSRHLSRQGLSMDEVVGYRVLDLDEEPEFRQQYRNEYATVVRYYAKK
ncbi:MAG: hypothetical protein Q8R47_05835 [Nanoarchaeota archaeon]|nr:hypothetical protein [Nanoarchaeota archaeon]